MKVLLVSQLPPPVHGSTLMTSILVETLNEIGYEWKIVERRFSKSVKDVGKFNVRKLASALWMPFRLLSSIWIFRPDVLVFFATNRKFSFLVDWILSEVTRLTSTRSVLYIHTVGYKSLAEQGRAWNWLVRRLLTSGEIVVCLGSTLAKDVTPWVQTAHVRVIPNTVASDPDVPERQTTSSILFLSNLLPEKGPQAFVEAAEAIHRVLPDRDFILAGAIASDSLEDELRLSISNRGLHTAVSRVTDVDTRRKWDLLGSAEVLLFPSRYTFEAQPLVVLEALSIGCPVVAFNVGGLPDIIDDGLNGYLVPIGETDLMVTRVLEICTSPEQRDSISRAARLSFEARHSRRAYTGNWTHVLSQFQTGVARHPS